MNKEKEIEKIKKCIGDLVYEKTKLRKAYNYYHCIRDAEQFKYLEDNYGIGVPTTISFTPLIKKHIDVLVGEYLELDPDLQVSCKDEKTVSNIMRDRQLKINEETFKYFKSKLENSIIDIIVEGKQPTNDPFFEQEIQKIKKDIDKNFVSEYEIAAQNILNYIRNSRDIDLKNKMRELLTDLLVSGTGYYRTKPSGNNTNIKLEILNPLDTFVERNWNEPYLNKSPRAVVRRWLTKEQILTEFEDELSSEAISKLDEKQSDRNNGPTVFISTREFINSSEVLVGRAEETPGILGGLEAAPTYPYGDSYASNSARFNRIPVYECEWIEYEDDKMVRHSGVEIGEGIYITRGVDENIVRSVSNPKECTLTVNGIFFNDKNGNPFSMILSTEDLQSRYDLLLYYRDNLIASSGTVGDWIDLAHLPTILGAELPERLAKWIAYKKNGTALFDSSQEGANILNTTFNGFDDTVKSQAIQAIQMAIESVEQQASSITGVFAEKLGGIQQRDAVSNVKVGIRQSTLLTKGYFFAMDTIYKEVNYDLLNLAKIVYKNGISGTIILGNKLSKIFTALPEYYTVTDFDIHIKDSTEMYEAKNTLTSASIELVKAGAASPTMIVDMAMAKNLTELRNCVKESIDEQEQKTNQLQQMQQQIQEYEQQLKQMQQQLQQLQNQNQQLQNANEKNSDEQLALEKKRVQIEEQTMRDKKDYNDKMAEAKKRQVDIEMLQLHDGNPYNDTVRDV